MNRHLFLLANLRYNLTGTHLLKVKNVFIKIQNNYLAINMQLINEQE